MVDTDTRHVIKPPKVLIQELGGEAVLLNLGNDLYYGMDENSFQMYKTLISSSSIQAAYEKLLEEYDIESQQLQSDLEAFLTNLSENELIIYAND